VANVGLKALLGGAVYPSPGRVPALPEDLEADVDYTAFVFREPENSAVAIRGRYPRRARMADDNGGANGAAPEALKREWPEHVPVGCPPADALDLDHTVYYLVETDPPTAKDMKCAIDRGSHKNKPPCYRASLSCGLDAQHVAARHPDGATDRHDHGAR
jgi:hypothetical protein